MQLPPDYSLFGKVVKGLEVIDEMQRVPTASGDRPKTDVVIESRQVTAIILTIVAIVIAAELFSAWARARIAHAAA